MHVLSSASSLASTSVSVVPLAVDMEAGRERLLRPPSHHSRRRLQCIDREDPSVRSFPIVDNSRTHKTFIVGKVAKVMDRSDPVSTM